MRFLGRGHELRTVQPAAVPCSATTRWPPACPGVFAGGDVVTGPDTVLNAMAAGKLAAEMIDKHIRGEPLVQEYGFLRPSTLRAAGAA